MKKLLIILAVFLFTVYSCSTDVEESDTKDVAKISEIVIINESSYDITQIYFTLSSSSTLGRNRLESNDILFSGREKTFTVDNGIYDIYIRTETDNTGYYHCWDRNSLYLENTRFSFTLNNQ